MFADMTNVMPDGSRDNTGLCSTGILSSFASGTSKNIMIVLGGNVVSRRLYAPRRL